MPSKDAWGAAFCCGTSSVIRFAALAQIGGFPTDSVTEDYLLTLRLKEIGYRTVYLNERADARPRAGRAQGIHHPARPLVPRLHADRARPQRPVQARQRFAVPDRLSLIESLLYWSAAYFSGWPGY